jgi:predicted MFS family arabinose efflux permease
MDRRLIAVVFAGFCAFLDTYATQPLLPMLQKDFHTDKVQVSLTISAVTLAVAIAAPFTGLFADRVGRKRIIVPAVFGLCIPTFFAAYAANLKMLIIWRFAQGLFMPAIFVVTVAYISEEWYGHNINNATAGYVTGTVIGGFCGRLLSGIIAAQHGWRAAFLVLGIINILCGVIIWVFLPRSRHIQRDISQKASIRDFGQHLKNPALKMIYMVGFCVLFSLVGTFTYITFYLSNPPFNLGATALGFIFFVYLIGAVITPLSGKWIAIWGSRKALGIALFFAMAGIFLTLIPSIIAVIIGLSICCSGIFVCQAAANSSIGPIAGRARASAVGLYVTSYYLGGCFGAILPGYLWNLGRWPACVGLIAIIQAAIIVFISKYPGEF